MFCFLAMRLTNSEARAEVLRQRPSKSKQFGHFCPISRPWDAFRGFIAYRQRVLGASESKEEDLF